MIKHSLIITALGTGLCLSALAAEDAEQKVNLQQLPAAAAKALQEQAGGAPIKSLSKEKDEGKTVFEASFKKDGRVREVTVDEKGKVVSIEDTITLPDAPEAVRSAIKREHPAGKVEKIERISEKGKIAYEALISDNSKREEITFDPKGKVTEREDKTGAKGKD